MKFVVAWLVVGAFSFDTEHRTDVVEAFSFEESVLGTEDESSLHLLQTSAKNAASRRARAELEEDDATSNSKQWVAMRASQWHGKHKQNKRVHTCTKVFSGDHTLAWPPPILAKTSDNKFCENQGVKDLGLYQHGIPLFSNTTFMPVFSSEPFVKRNEEIKRAVIYLHGHQSNANRYFCDALGLPKLIGEERSTLTIVPWFAEDQVASWQWEGVDTLMNRTGPNAKPQMSFCWSRAKDWITGGNAEAHKMLTAFDVMDQMVKALRGEYAKTVFPNLQRVTLVGFSGGCQLLSRWAVLSDVATPKPGLVNVTVVAGDCGSYLYLDKTRPKKSCRGKKDTGIHHWCNKFKKPHTRANFNRFKYGLSFNEKEVRENHYLMAFAANNSESMHTTLRDFHLKDVRFIFGGNDVCSCNWKHFHNKAGCFPKKHHKKFYRVFCRKNKHGGKRHGIPCCDQGLNHNLASMWQGTNRLQRGLNYMSHLAHFNKRLGIKYKPQFKIAKHAFHDSFTVLRSAEASELIFDKVNWAYIHSKDWPYLPGQRPKKMCKRKKHLIRG